MAFQAKKTEHSGAKKGVERLTPRKSRTGYGGKRIRKSFFVEDDGSRQGVDE